MSDKQPATMPTCLAVDDDCAAKGCQALLKPRAFEMLRLKTQYEHEAKSLRAQLAETQERLKEADELLRDLEWASHDGGGNRTCPCCRQRENTPRARSIYDAYVIGHRADCALRAYLAAGATE